MPTISTTRLDDCVAEHNAETIRATVVRFGELLSTAGVQSVKASCSWNPDLPDDSPLQSPEETISPHLIAAFLDTAVKNGVWMYGDNWNRAGVDALDGSFRFLLGNDKDMNLATEDLRLLEAVRSDWVRAGYEVYEGSGKEWVRVHPCRQT